MAEQQQNQQRKKVNVNSTWTHIAACLLSRHNKPNEKNTAHNSNIHLCCFPIALLLFQDHFLMCYLLLWLVSSFIFLLLLLQIFYFQSIRNEEDIENRIEYNEKKDTVCSREMGIDQDVYSMVFPSVFSFSYRRELECFYGNSTK